MNNILYIPSWYPNRTAPADGNFIKRLIEADARYDKVSVLFATPDPMLKAKYQIAVTDNNGYCEVIVYFRQVKGNSLFALPAKVFRRMGANRMGLKELKKCGVAPQLIHVQAALPAILYARRLSRRLNIPYLVTEHGIGYQLSEKKSLTDKLLFRFMKAAYAGAAVIVTVSRYLGEAMRNNGIKNDYRVIPNVVPLPDTPMPAGAAPPAKKRILHISTLAEVKNAHGIINAIKQVSLKRNDFELLVVSDTEEQKELKEYVNASGLNGGVVKFLPYIHDSSEILKLISSSSFMVLFSNYETFSVVLAESLWAGRPVVTSKCGGPEEFISPEFGLLVEPRDEKGLERAITTMLDTSSNYDPAKMRLFARTHFAPEVIGKRLCDLHNEILKGR
ncbi:MAG: glycosyltransferase [Bacteroidia bacterium]|nr:glycosyltransferase [Bacteroidia bacterium]